MHFHLQQAGLSLHLLHLDPLLLKVVKENKKRLNNIVHVHDIMMCTYCEQQMLYILIDKSKNLRTEF